MEDHTPAVTCIFEQEVDEERLAGTMRVVAGESTPYDQIVYADISWLAHAGPLHSPGRDGGAER